MISLFISKNYIKYLISSIDILELISKYLNFIKKGDNSFALCPFHIEKTPSFVVNIKKQCFHCFGCDIHGNIIDFIMKINNLTFIEAVKEISDLYNYTLPISPNNKINNNYINDKNIFYSLMKEISIIYNNNINYNSIINNFLIKRNINNESIKLFQIGYAPKNNLLVNYYHHNKYLLNILINIGLIKKKNNQLFDFFRNRIIFPIYNKIGKIVAFGGRIINNNNIKLPKYINSLNNEYFNKSNNLYGLDKFLKNKLSFNKLLIVEGYIDVIKLHQYNIHYVIGLLGGTINEVNIRLLFQLSNNIIICLDGDESGYKASLKLIKLALPYIRDNNQLNFIKLSLNEDPDSYIEKKSKKLFLDKINNSIPFYNILINDIFNNIDISTLQGKSYILSKSQSLLSNLNNKSLKLFIIDKIYEKLGILNKEHYNKLFINNSLSIYSNNNNNIKYTNLNLLLSLLIQNPYLYIFIPNSFFKLKYIKNNGINIIKTIYYLCIKYKNITTAIIIEFFRFNKCISIIKKLSIWKNLINKKNIKYIFIDLIFFFIYKDFKLELKKKLSNKNINYNKSIKIFKLIKFLKNNKK